MFLSVCAIAETLLPPTPSPAQKREKLDPLIATLKEKEKYLDSKKNIEIVSVSCMQDICLGGPF